MAAFGFIENDKLDIRNIGHQAGFGFADNPGDWRFRPGILNGADDGERMAGIADRRKTDDTNTLWRRLLEHLMKAGNKK
jgi:hypothetical protein